MHFVSLCIKISFACRLRPELCLLFSATVDPPPPPPPPGVCLFLSLSHTCHLQQWSDYRLSWNKSEYYDIAIIRVPCKTVWLPDIVLENK